MPGLPTVGTPGSRRNSRPSRHLKTSRWPAVVHTGHVRYDQDSEPSKSVKRETSELPMNQPEINKNFIVAWTHTEHVRYQYRTCSVLPDQQKQVRSFVSQTLKTHMGWLEHL